MTTIYQESQSGGYSMKSILSKTQDTAMTSKYGHLSVPLGLLCQIPSIDTKEAQKISYKDAPIVSDKLFDTLFHTSNVDSERKKSGGGNFTRKKRNKKPIVGKNTKKNKSKHK